ncbi:MAG: Uma2 family endonuclease [Pyrinomonadaceae bacterium]
MTPNPLPNIMTPEEFLAFERASDEKHEYRDGEVVLMSGAKLNHNRISTNLTGLLWQGLKGKDCENYSNDLRVWVPKSRLYTYPDGIVVCGEPQFLDDEFDTLLNPVLIFEILSESTESYDRGRKFKNYRSIDSLKEYVLISQTSPSIEKYTKHGDGFWMLSEASGIDSNITFESIDCTLSLTDIYDKVSFDAE